MAETTYLDGVIYNALQYGIANKGAYYSHITASSSSPYTIGAADEVVLVTTGASAFTLNLPAATATGRKLLIIKVDSGAGAVTVTPNGSDTIEGAGTKSLSSQYAKIGLIDGVSTAWSDIGTGGV